MSHWIIGKNWSDQFLPQIKGILGLHLIGEPPEKEDQEHNTDLMVLNMAAVRIGCRVRRTSYMESYRREFTIRSSWPSGAKTELAKIVEGWGDYFFYGFGDDNALAAYTLLDLKGFRLVYHDMIKTRNFNFKIKRNMGGADSSFHVFQWSDFKDSIIASEYLEQPEQKAI